DDYPNENTEKGFIRKYPKSSDGTERVWRRSYESCLKEIERGNIICTENYSIYLVTDNTDKFYPVFSNWTDKKYNAGIYGTNILKDIIGNSLFSYPKSLYNVKDCISISSKENSIILDYFPGSGTTAHAVIELNKEDDGKRKYLLTELGDHFNTVIIPRIKKISFTDKWKDGKAQEGGQGYSNFFKYYELEQYEETLRKAKYEDKGALPKDIYHQYLFFKDLKLADEVAKLDDETRSIKIDLTKLHEKIDIPETLSFLTGKFIKQIFKDKVVFTDGSEIEYTNIDYKIIKPLIWW
ncbi:TPA: hypothetical protein EYG96_01230, partial [Candidatus Gracilibacteria bacterium]|nr:hypothetical protein [Candidatus Gracilibacteria bacterium]